MKPKAKIRVKEGSGNVFADLGFANPEREELKARFTLQIYRLIKARGLTPTCLWVSPFPSPPGVILCRRTKSICS